MDSGVEQVPRGLVVRIWRCKIKAPPQLAGLPIDVITDHLRAGAATHPGLSLKRVILSRHLERVCRHDRKKNGGEFHDLLLADPITPAHQFVSVMGSCPLSRRRHPLACRYHRSMSNGGDQIPMAPRLHAQHTEATFLAVKGHAIDQAGEHFLVYIVCLLGHSASSPTLKVMIAESVGAITSLSRPGLSPPRPLLRVSLSPGQFRVV